MHAKIITDAVSWQHFKSCRSLLPAVHTKPSVKVKQNMTVHAG